MAMINSHRDLSKLTINSILTLMLCISFYYLNSGLTLINITKALVYILIVISILHVPILKNKFGTSGFDYYYIGVLFVLGISSCSWLTGSDLQNALIFIYENRFTLMLIILSMLGLIEFVPRRETIHADDMIAQGAILYSLMPRIISKRDEKYAAAHEAGHALVYSALGNLPEHLEVVINSNYENNTIGYISTIKSKDYLSEMMFIEWSMLVYLAGKFGEEFAFGKTTAGSISDNIKWLDEAKRYLSVHSNGVFYIEPTNIFEQKLNEEKLLSLRNKQIKMLGELFTTNAKVFEDIQQSLLEKKRLDRIELGALLRGVNVPEGFPLPFGKFDDFTDEVNIELGIYVEKLN